MIYYLLSHCSEYVYGQARNSISGGNNARFGYLYPRTTIWDARILIKGDKVGKRAVNESIWYRLKIKELL